MNELEKARSEINAIDEQMAKLFQQRFVAVKKIIEYKIENCMPIKDNNREQELIEKNLTYIDDEDLKSYYRLYFQYLMDVSKKYQKDYLDSK